MPVMLGDALKLFRNLSNVGLNGRLIGGNDGGGGDGGARNDFGTFIVRPHSPRPWPRPLPPRVESCINEPIDLPQTRQKHIVFRNARRLIEDVELMILSCHHALV